MDETTDTATGNETVEALAETVRSMAAEIERLRAIVEAPPAPPAPVADVDPDPTVTRRAALRRGGVMAAGAVAGGAAIVALTAEPAAAATLTGSGAPGVNATGVGGDGLNASTDSVSKSGVFAHTNVNGAYGIFTRHDGNGLAIQGQSNSTGPAAFFVNSGTGGGLSAASGNGNGIEVVNAKTGAVLTGTETGITVRGNNQTMYFLSITDVSPPQSTKGHNAGALSFDGNDLWWCTAAGTPGTFRKVVGKNTAGQFHVLPTPVRAYDSRPGTQPAVGSKTKLSPNTPRTINLTGGGASIPSGATAALLTILLVNATSGNGNFTVWANGQPLPHANTLVWGGSAGRFTTSAVTAIDSMLQVQIVASLKTDVVIDVVGYYR